MYIVVVYSYMLMEICCPAEDLVCVWARVLWIKESAVHTALSIFCFQIVYDDIAYMRKRHGSCMKKAWRLYERVRYGVVY